MDKASFSIYEYFNYYLFKVFEACAIGFSKPFSSIYDKTAPNPTDAASVAKMKFFSLS